MATYGYVRINPADPSGKGLSDETEALGVPQEYIFIDKQDGKTAAHPGLARLLDTVERGDVVVVESIGQLARSAKDFLSILETLTEKGADFVSRKEEIDTSTPTGKLMLKAFAVVMELEREFARERQEEGAAAAKARGIRFGRPITKPPEDFVEIVELWESKQLHISEVLDKTGLKPATFYNRLREYRKLRGADCDS